MASPPPQLDIVTLAIAVVTLLTGPELAALVGPYTVILLASLGGAAWSATKIEQRPRMATVKHMALMMGLALLLTVPFAEAFARLSGIDARWAFGPIAAIIAARPEWAIGWVERWLSTKGVHRGDPPQQGGSP